MPQVSLTNGAKASSLSIAPVQQSTDLPGKENLGKTHEPSSNIKKAMKKFGAMLGESKSNLEVQGEIIRVCMDCDRFSQQLAKSDSPHAPRRLAFIKLFKRKMEELFFEISASKAPPKDSAIPPFVLKVFTKTTCTSPKPLPNETSRPKKTESDSTWNRSLSFLDEIVRV